MLLSRSIPPPAHSHYRVLHTRRTTSSVSFSQRPLRYAVLGAGFAGLSVAWHLLQESPKDLGLRIDIYDEMGIGGGASGVSGGLLHPYSPKGKLLLWGAECWKECSKLLNIAEAAVGQNSYGFIVQRRGILRPAMNMKNLLILNDNAQNCLASCRIDTVDKETAQTLVPKLCVPFNSAFYMPEAVNIHPQRYLQALFLACENLVKELTTSGFGGKELCLHKKSIHKLLDFEALTKPQKNIQRLQSFVQPLNQFLSMYKNFVLVQEIEVDRFCHSISSLEHARNLLGEYDAVVVCLGAKADLLPELSGRLPLRTCRGIVAHLMLPADMGEDYPDHSPSILSDAWLAFQGPRSLYMGSTWEWKSRNSLPNVSANESSSALQELLPKASTVYPAIKHWTFTGARAGLRAMPPLTPHGSLPLLGCLNDVLGGNHTCNYWLFGGLGSRGLLYHGWLGKLTAQAMLSANEELIPSELTSWKKIKQ